MEDLRELLQDLIQINNDRIEGYNKAAELLPKDHNEDLHSNFARFRNQSQDFIRELEPFIEMEGETATTSTMVSGKLFRMWMGIKTNITGHDRLSVLESCERGEDAFKKAYTEALQDADEIPVALLNTIRHQSEEQYMAHDYIKTVRDAARQEPNELGL